MLAVIGVPPFAVDGCSVTEATPLTAVIAPLTSYQALVAGNPYESVERTAKVSPARPLTERRNDPSLAALTAELITPVRLFIATTLIGGWRSLTAPAVPTPKSPSGRLCVEMAAGLTNGGSLMVMLPEPSLTIVARTSSSRRMEALLRIVILSNE